MLAPTLTRICVLAAAAAALPGFAARVRPPMAEDILARSRATYAALESYADSGTVLLELGPANGIVRERHSFHTYYRAPRAFLFDFTKSGNVDRFVVWSDDQAFHTWWKTTGVAENYPKGQGTAAFVTGTVPTASSLTQIAPLLFSSAGLAGTLTELGDATAAGTEKVDGHPCYKLTGVAKSVYKNTGHETNFRRTTVWIDSASLLVRRILEEPRGTPPGTVDRRTTTFSPHANPALAEASFRFTPPQPGN